MGYQNADDRHAYARKKAVAPYLWNGLLGVDNPKRLGDRNAGS